MSKDDGKDQRAITKFLLKEMNKGQDLPIAFSLKEPNPTEVKDFISTGSTLLDYIIANRRDGGVPMGKLTEIVGEEATGKSLLATQILANTQKKGGIAIYLDTENAANPDFMQRVGLDIEKLVYMNPGTIEECYAAIEKTILMARAKDTQCPITIVWDSTAATPAKAEVEGDYDKQTMGLAAKSHALGLRKIVKMVGAERVTLVFCNQLKMRIGVIHGDPFFAPGGKAVPYIASIRIKLTKGKKMEAGENAKLKEVYGVQTKAKIIKSRLGPGFRTASFDILFASGIDDVNSIRDYLWAMRGFITKSNGFMKMIGPDGEEVKFRERAWKEMMDEPKFREYVLNKLEEFMVVKYTDQDIPDAEVDEEDITSDED